MNDTFPSLIEPPINFISDEAKIILRKFSNFFDIQPTICVKAPGRVNLIGEHIDYCGYGVFPMAIKQNVMIAASERKDKKLSITNTEPLYEDYCCDINNIEIVGDKPHWYNYILCGIMGIRDFLGKDTPLQGISLALSGSIPPSSGLSSSSAIVCAASLVITHFQQLSLTLNELADICAKSERYIGTLGGGMDQAAILLSRVGFAQMIEFNPLKCTPVQLPDGATFVIANSLAPKNKADSSDYNCRVIECRLAHRILAAKSNVVPMESLKLHDLQVSLGKSLPEMVELVKSFLHFEPYTKMEICDILKISFTDLEENILTANAKHLTEFHLHKRAMHVFTEAARVLQFRKICNEWALTGRSNSNNLEALNRLGHLMIESHNSAQYLYECSHPLLDKLVDISKNVALGARLTGAGWGGCIVALVLKDRIEEYVNLLKKNFFAVEEHTKTCVISEALFNTEPSERACIYKL